MEAVPAASRRRGPRGLGQLKRMLISGGVAPELYNELKEEYAARNRNSLRILSILGVCEGLMLVISHLVDGDFSPALPLYTVLLVAAVFFAVISGSGHPKDRTRLLVSCYAVLCLALLYGLGIAFQRPAPNDRVASTFMVLYVALPLMFTDTAWRMLLFQAAWSLIFAVSSRMLSSPEVFEANLLNVYAFTALAAVLYTTISCDHVRQVVDHVLLEDETERVNAIQSAMLMRLSNVIEGRDEDTGGHVTRTCAFVGDLLYDLRQGEQWRQRLSESWVRHVVASASLHDMGKLKIPDAVLNKPGRLTDEEFETMKLHSVYGEELIARTLGGLLRPNELKIACNIARSHHERWDGKGYPDGLAGEDISLEARAMALADVFDALTHERVYKPAMSVEEAIQIIEEERGTHFDPLLTDLFVARRRVEGTDVSQSPTLQSDRMQFGLDEEPSE